MSPIEPGVGCNAHFILLTDGTIVSKASLTRREKHSVNSTCGMLGLNTAVLVNERKQWIATVTTIMEAFPEQLDTFLQKHPFRYILKQL
ncbi:MAG: hypothetical protein HRT35_37710 [Algicola sp.]|nr:hypothetical protein [Algicola sp.]